MCYVKRKLSYNDVPINYISRYPEDSLSRNYNDSFRLRPNMLRLQWNGRRFFQTMLKNSGLRSLKIPSLWYFLMKNNKN